LRPTAITHLAVWARNRIPFGDLLSLRRWKMKIRPLYDRIIVKRIEQQRATASGIVERVELTQFGPAVPFCQHFLKLLAGAAQVCHF
jgi:hypothetical protein